MHQKYNEMKLIISTPSTIICTFADCLFGANGGDKIFKLIFFFSTTWLLYSYNVHLKSYKSL